MDGIRGLETDGPVERHSVGYGLPAQIAEGDQSGGSVATRHGCWAEDLFGQNHPLNQQLSVLAVKIEDPGQSRVLIVTEQPRVTVDLGRKNERPIKGLQYELVLPAIEAGGKTHAVVFGEPFQIRHQSTAEPVRAVVGGRDAVGREDVRVGLPAFPKKGRGMLLRPLETETVVEEDQVGAVLSAFGHHANEGIFLFGAQWSAHSVELEESEIEVAAQADHLLASGGFLGRRIAKAVGATPNAEAGPHLRSELPYRREAVRKLLFETIGTDTAVKALAVDSSGIEGVDIELHAVLVVKPTEELEVDHRLGFGGALVGVVDP